MGPVTLDPTPPVPAGPQQSRTALVSFLGAVVRRTGNWMPIAGTIELMGQFGLDAPSVRTAVFRLKKRGWLAIFSIPTSSASTIMASTSGVRTS